jgi:hypothetical protein
VQFYKKSYHNFGHTSVTLTSEMKTKLLCWPISAKLFQKLIPEWQSFELKTKYWWTDRKKERLMLQNIYAP